MHISCILDSLFYTDNMSDRRNDELKREEEEEEEEEFDACTNNDEQKATEGTTASSAWSGRIPREEYCVIEHPCINNVCRE